jgi:hypothetical protein
VKRKSAVVAKIVVELLAKIRDGSAEAAGPAVLRAEVLPYGGLAKVWIFGVQFAPASRRGALLGPVEVSALRNERAGTAMTASRTSPSFSPGQGLRFRTAASMRQDFFPAVQLYGWRLFRGDREPALNTDP